jgi:hypothetical protein
MAGPSRAASPVRRLASAASICAGGIFLAGLINPVPAAEQSLQPVSAIWARQQLLFYYVGHRTLYTCRTIEEKIRAILLDMGAREDLEVEASGCAQAFHLESRTLTPPGRPPQAVITMPAQATSDIRVAIDVATPLELTPALRDLVLQKQREELGKRELLARIGNGEELAAGIKTFPAAWQRVELSRSAEHLDDSDCELVGELATQILPQLRIRLSGSAVRCAASQSGSRGSEARLAAEALLLAADADSLALPTP